MANIESLTIQVIGKNASEDFRFFVIPDSYNCGPWPESGFIIIEVNDTNNKRIRVFRSEFTTPKEQSTK